MVDTAAPQRVWSAALRRAVGRLLAAGVLTGAGAGVVLVLLTVFPSLADDEELSWLDVISVAWMAALGTVAGAACALPVVLLTAATALVAAVRSPRRHRLALGLLVLWPAVGTATAAGAWFGDLVRGGLLHTVLSVVVLVVLVVVTVVRTRAWVLAPLRNGQAGVTLRRGRGLE